MRGSAFHSSSRLRSRLAPARQSLPSASFSASATSFSLATLASAALRPLGLAGLALRRDHRPSDVEPAGERGEVADRVGVGDLRRTVFTDSAASSGDITPELTRCSSRSTSNGERLVALGEEGQRLLGGAGGVLADRPLAVGGPDVDGAVLVDPTPLVHRPLAHHCVMIVNRDRA